MKNLLKTRLFPAASLGVSAISLAVVCTNAFAEDELAGGSKAGSLVIEDFIGTIEIREANTFSYSLDMNANLMSEPTISEGGDTLTISGDAGDIKVRECYSKNDTTYLRLKNGDRHALSEFPKLTINMPAGHDASIELINGELDMEDAGNLLLSLKGCGDVEFGNVAGHLDLGIYGSSDVEGGNAISADVSIKGSGDLELGDTVEGMKLSITGSGDVEMGDVGGSLMVDIRGSGDALIGEANELIEVEIRGSGDVEIGGGSVQKFDAKIYGSGEVEFDGTANDVSVLLFGSGDVYVARSDWRSESR